MRDITFSQLAKNHIFVKKLCAHNKVSIEFFLDSFEIKDFAKGILLLNRGTEDGLYKFLFHTNFALGISINNVVYNKNM